MFLAYNNWVHVDILLLLQLQEDKIRAIQEKLELCEQKLAQYAKLPDMEQELKQRMEALTQVRAQVRVTKLWITEHTHTILTNSSSFGTLNFRFFFLDNFINVHDYIIR